MREGNNVCVYTYKYIYFEIRVKYYYDDFPIPTSSDRSNRFSNFNNIFDDTLARSCFELQSTNS